jgi:SAM-dependent MidA family methyltransferase
LSEIEPALENTALVEAVRAEIAREDRITFARFMELALYHPRYGYYNSRREKMGRSGDYVTSPEVHPIFAAMIGRQAREMWEIMGRPSRFDLVELGGGTGAFARDLLRWSRREADDLSRALRYVLVERSTRQRQRQEETLEDAGIDPESVTWVEALPEAIAGCIFSNELFDAMPVHLVTASGGKLQEIYVAVDAGRFCEVSGPPSTPELGRYFERLGITLSDGVRAEVNLGAPALMAQMATSLKSGFVLTLDYGYTAEGLYAPWRKQGTLLCFHRHGYTDNPFAHIGHQDITAHVDFTTLIETGRARGLDPLGMVRQAEFLSNLGIAEALGMPSGQDFEEYAARRRAVLELSDTVGLGRITALAQAKGFPNADLSGLRAIRERLTST